MNYFKYIFSDKKGLLYWIFAMVFILMYLSVSIFANYHDRQPKWIFLTVFSSLVIIALIFIVFYTISFINVKFQNKFLDTYLVNVIKKSVIEMEVVLYLNSITTTTFKTNFPVKITPKPKKEVFRVFLMDNCIGILGHSYELGIFRKHLRPIIIPIKNEKIENKYKFALTPSVGLIEENNNDLNIVFSKSVKGIIKLTLKDFKKIYNTQYEEIPRVSTAKNN
jgi:hypothetical protein